MNASAGKLLIDMGNTRIKWATMRDGALAATGEVLHRGRQPEQAMEFLGRIDAVPEAVLAANVAGDKIGSALAGAVRGHWNLPVGFAATQPSARDVRNGYSDYRQMGVDRWLAILAARHRYGRAACIVDAGTAVTIDQIDDSGQHLGGVIVPGLDLMRRSLADDTGNIARLDDGADAAGRLTCGTGTAEAIGGGTLSAICGLIEACAQELAAHCSARGHDRVLVITGGDAGRIVPYLKIAAEHRPALVLEGLMRYEF